MAAPSKKRAVGDLVEENQSPDEIEDDMSGEDDNFDVDDDLDASEEDELVDQSVTVEFEARNLEDSDFHGVRKLLAQLFVKANIDLSELTNTLLSQNYIGSAIKQVEIDEEDSDSLDDEDDSNQVFGLISLLNLTEKQSLGCVQQLKSTLLEKCAKCSDRKKLASFLSDQTKQVGWIVNERFINIPATIAVPSFESLWKEMERANKKNMKYNFTHFLMVSKICKMVLPSGDSAPHAVFINTEEEIFSQAADVTCEYSVKEEVGMATQGRWDDDDEDMEPYRVAMVIASEKIPDIMTKIKEAYG